MFTQLAENIISRASLEAQWERIHLPMQETRVLSVIREDSACHRTTKPRLTSTEPALGAWKLQLLSSHVRKPAQLEPALRRRSRRIEESEGRDQDERPLSTRGGGPHSSEYPAPPQINQSNGILKVPFQYGLNMRIWIHSTLLLLSRFSHVPGILQARTLEWGAISFSNA